MKKLIMIFSVFAIIYVVLSQIDANATKGGADTVSASTTQTLHKYEIKGINNRVVVYKDDVLYYRTDTSLDTLPKKDKRELLEGITVYGEKQLKQTIADYCS